MNTKPLIINSLLDNEEIQILLNPTYPGSITYYIYVDRENQGMVQKVSKEWIVKFIDNSKLTDLHQDAIIRSVTNAESINN